MMRLTKFLILLALAGLVHPFTAMAQSYSTKDAQYVTNSRNDAVLRYIVCLELVASTLPSSMSVPNRLKRGEAECKNAAARLPKSAREPDVADIRGMLLECGFRASDASSGSDCRVSVAGGAKPGPKRPGRLGAGAANSTRNGAPVVADDVDIAPRVIELGKWIEGLAHDGSYLWAAESGQRTIAKVNYKTGKVVERLKVGRLPIEIISADKDIYTLVATDKVVLRHDSRGRKSQVAKLKLCPSAMEISGSDLFVLGEPDCSSDTSQLVRVDTDRGNQKTSPDLGQWATSMTVVGADIWVGHARGEKISVVSGSSLRTSKLAVSGIEIWAMAANRKSVFAGGRYETTDHDGSVVMIDARSRREISRFSATELITQINADEDKVVVVGAEGTVWILSANDLNLLRTIRLDTGKYEPKATIFVGKDLVIAAGQHRGENGAAFVLTDYMPAGQTRSATNKFKPRPGIRPTRPGLKSPKRPGRPTASRPTPRPTAGQRPDTRPSRPDARPTRSGSRPSKAPSARPGSEFPVLAGSVGGRVRAQASITAAQIASTSSGQAITVLRRTNKIYKGYPWFSIRLGNGDRGYQWGGIICANKKAISGTKGRCETRRPTPPSAPGIASGGNSGTRSGNNQTNAADIVVGVLDLVGKILDNKNDRKNNKAVKNAGNGVDVFRQRLYVDADTGGVSSVRKVNDGQLAIYTVSGIKGQTLQTNLWSNTGNAAFEIYIKNAVKGGATLPGAGDGDYATFHQGVLPLTGNYQIVVGSTGGRSSYELTVALQEPVRAFDPSTKAGKLNAPLVVGTYTSKTGTSGNILLNGRTGALSWTEFCGAQIGLTPNWPKSRLSPRSRSLKPFQLNVRNGTVLGFKSGKDTYIRQDNVMMPGCVAATPGNNSKASNNSNRPAKTGNKPARPAKPAKPAVAQAADWTLAPKDQRQNKNYNDVPVAYWSTCESGNLDPTSPAFNNEKAYWDCADEGLRLAAQANVTGIASDPRAGNDYSIVSQARIDSCEAANPNKAKDATGYYDCLEQAQMDTLEELEDASTDPAVTGNAAPGTKGKGKQGAGATSGNIASAPDWTINPQDLRAGNDYSAVAVAEWNACETANADVNAASYNNEAAFWDCLETAAKTAGGANAVAASWMDNPQDRRLNNDYTAITQDGWDFCEAVNADPNSPDFNNETRFWDCADKTLAAGGPPPTVTDPATANGATSAAADWTNDPQDQRLNGDYSTVPDAAWAQCETANGDANSPSYNNETMFWDCADKAVAAAAAGTTAADPAADPNADPATANGAASAAADWTNDPQDQRLNGDYSTVPDAAWAQCETANGDANSPSYNNETMFWDCADKAVAAAAAGTTAADPAADPNADPATANGAASAAADWTNDPQDQRLNGDYSTVPDAAWAQCETANGDANSPSYNNETMFWDCADKAVAAAAAGTTAADPAADPNADPATANGATSAAADWTNDPQDQRLNGDYSTVPDAAWAQCETANGDANSPSYNNETMFWDCADKAVAAAAAGTPTADPAADPNADPATANGATSAADWTNDPQDQRLNGDYSAVPDAAWAQCETANGDTNSPSYNNETMFWDCADKAVAAAAAGVTPAADPATADPVDNSSADQRMDKDYSSLPMGYFTTCGQEFGENSSPYFDCLDSGLASEAINQRVASEFSDITDEEIQGCASYGYGSDDFFNCLYAVRDHKAAQQQQQQQQQQAESDAAAANQQAEIDQRVANEFPDLNGEEIESCASYGYGSDDFFNCLYAVRDNKAAQQQQEQQQQQQAESDAAAANQQAEIDQRVANEFPDLNGEEVESCASYGYGSDDFINCLYAVRDNKAAQQQQEQQQQQQAESDAAAANQQAEIDQRVASEFSDISGEEIQGCASYGYGSDDFFNCLYAVRDNKAAQQQQEQEQNNGNEQMDQSGAASVDDTQETLNAIQSYCYGNYAEAEAGQCYQAIEQCVYAIADHNSEEFNQCAQGQGW
ncbi:hypothetical protein OEG84_05715 [Hoeflea sp. G2-23]|uniref:SH3b domain-containing protein n=1 Tax=Hoeflea algicola TaxID=2983763 RepID=A0ABT3Z618_9HYPH|nr:hypothetical protein [Hoeflea algicola]MCY0147221.1 hypothetical protein [Hoeflea algicola]